MQPLLLVFEDLHWIDAETQALLESLADSLPTARLLLLVNYRPEYQHGWGSKPSTRNCDSTPYRPRVPTHSCRRCLVMIPAWPPRAALDCAHRGQPLLPGGERAHAGGDWGAGGRGRGVSSTQALPTVQVPATVQAVLAARIDRLPPEEKWLLQTAAVVGTEVPLPLLQAIAELAEATLHRGLAYLQAAEFLYETRLFPERNTPSSMP